MSVVQVVKRSEKLLIGVKLRGAWGGNELFEVLKCWGLHLIMTNVPVGGNADKNVNFIFKKLTSDCIDFDRVGGWVGWHAPRPP